MTGPRGGSDRYCSYLAMSSSTAEDQASLRHDVSNPSARTHHNCVHSSS